MSKRVTFSTSMSPSNVDTQLRQLALKVQVIAFEPPEGLKAAKVTLEGHASDLRDLLEYWGFSKREIERIMK